MASMRGFTLIEMMVVVVILGILAGIAYPNYQNWVVSGRRTDARIALTRAAADFEKFYAECGVYPDPATAKLTAARSCANEQLGWANMNSPDGHYLLSATVSGTFFAINASTQGRQTKDTQCAGLSLNSRGEKGASPATNVNTCWPR